MEPIALDDELLARIERIGGDARVESLLDRLTPEQADAVRARVLDEEDYAEIAARLRCSESVVRQRVHRGLADAAPDLRGGSVMTEFPALREAWSPRPRAAGGAAC